jgi:hypothetical protein
MLISDTHLQGLNDILNFVKTCPKCIWYLEGDENYIEYVINKMIEKRVISKGKQYGTYTYYEIGNSSSIYVGCTNYEWPTYIAQNDRYYTTYIKIEGEYNCITLLTVFHCM